MKYSRSETDITKDTVVCYCPGCGENIESIEHSCQEMDAVYCADCGDKIGKNEENWQNHESNCWA